MQLDRREGVRAERLARSRLIPRVVRFNQHTADAAVVYQIAPPARWPGGMHARSADHAVQLGATGTAGDRLLSTLLRRATFLMR